MINACFLTASRKSQIAMEDARVLKSPKMTDNNDIQSSVRLDIVDVNGRREL